MAGQNSVSGGNHHGRGPRTRRRARLGGLGFTKRETEGTRELGGRRGSRLCRFGGWERRQSRWPPWPTTMARRACGQSSGSQQKRENSYREIEGRTAKLTAGKDGVDGGSGKTATRKGAGRGSRGSGEGLCSLFVEAGGAGRDAPTSGSGRGGCVMDWA